MIKLYGPARSRTFRCLWTLEELGLPYENVPVDLRAGEHRTPEFLKLNPLARVPVLQDDTVTLFESAAICTYLAEKHPEKKLIPKPGTKERAYYYQWVSYVTTELEQGLWTMGKHKFALPKEKRVPDMIAVGAWEFSKISKVLENAVQSKQYLVGDTFTVADLLAAHTLLWAKGFEVPITAPLEKYLADLQKRPAFQKVLALRNAS